MLASWRRCPLSPATFVPFIFILLSIASTSFPTRETLSTQNARLFESPQHNILSCRFPCGSHVPFRILTTSRKVGSVAGFVARVTLIGAGNRTLTSMTSVCSGSHVSSWGLTSPSSAFSAGSLGRSALNSVPGTVVGGLLAWCPWGWHQLEVTPMGIRRPR